MDIDGQKLNWISDSEVARVMNPNSSPSIDSHTQHTPYCTPFSLFNNPPFDQKSSSL